MISTASRKPSRYNLFVRRDDGTVICHNLLQGTTFKVGMSTFLAIAGLFEGENPDQTIDTLAALRTQNMLTINM